MTDRSTAQRPPTGVSVACPAKVNLFLRILAREDSGYHQIETLFQAIGIFDDVTVRQRERPGISLKIHREPSDASAIGDVIGDLGDPAQNTVTRAAQAFFAATGIAPAVTIVLRKSIPAGTGLGGGSSDAAGTLLALNRLYARPLRRSDLLTLSGAIGSDVPFFCARVAIALAWGRGNRLLACAPRPVAHVVVAIPSDRVSTATAYREASRCVQLPATPAVLNLLDRPRWDALKSMQANDFERSIFSDFPHLGDVRTALADNGATVARLTGSGSAVFGVFESRSAATRAAHAIRCEPGVAATLVAPTLTEFPQPMSAT